MEIKPSGNRLPAFLQNRIGETAVGAAIGGIAGLAWGEAAKAMSEYWLHNPEHLRDFPVIAGPLVGAVAVGYAFSKAGAASRQRKNSSEIWL